MQDQPAASSRLMLACLVALVMALLLWASLAHVDMVASAEGHLVPASLTKLVQPAQAGPVEQVFVREGEAVSEGQLLIRLDARVPQADAAALAAELALKRITLRRIDSEFGGAVFKALPAEAPALVAQVDAKFSARARAHLDALAQETESQNRLRAELRAAEQLRRKLAEVVPIHRQSAESFRKLQNEGYVGELAAADKEREYLERAHDLESQAATVEALGAAVSQAQRKLTLLKSDYKAQLETERTEVFSQVARLEQEQLKSNVRTELQDVRAPHAGIVKDLQVAKGSVVGAGEALLHLVPVGERLQAEVYLRNEDVGFVSEGQRVRLKVAAYPFQRHGMVEGEVQLVSADVSDPRQLQRNEQPALAYKALVRIDKGSFVGADGERLRLTPGMSVIADIVQGQRTVLEYLLSPVRKVVLEAGRES